jgi:hypothetical protein
MEQEAVLVIMLKKTEKNEALIVPPITEFCKKFRCWEGRIVDGVRLDTREMLEKTYGEIKKRPIGEFKMDPDIVKPMIASLRK